MLDGCGVVNSVGIMYLLGILDDLLLLGCILASGRLDCLVVVLLM